ncbi:MAG: family 78 glycoside hydrolase catalytic domain [Verrucomicrobia bacterium]|nr:family 78 glycoside hydrolase catalytic domain [Verrucomicrobiota bacterium]
MNIHTHRCLAAGLIAAVAVLSCPLNAFAADLTNPRCEYLVNPQGIDVTQPRLSWKIEVRGQRSEVRGQRQSAYQVLVASTLELLAKDQGDLWDSGKVASDQSIQVEYAGKQLASRRSCHWKVRLWDQDGKVSAWSQPALWTMGLLKPDDWQAKWIGLDQTQSSMNTRLGPAQWIWFPEGEPASSVPVGVRYFRRTVSLPAGRKIVKASVAMTADNAFALYVNGRKAGQGDDLNAPVAMDLTAILRAGANTLAVAATNVGDAPNPAGLIAALTVEFAEGSPLVVGTDPQWKSNQAKEEGWERAGFNDARWPAAKALGAFGIGPWGQLKQQGGDEARRLPARYLRREFQVDKKVARATAYVCGLGLFELRLNGAKVGDHVLEPGLTDYDKRCYYVTFDVTDRLCRGGNALGVVLGNGRFWAMRLNVPTRTRSFGTPRLLLQLAIDYTDGSRSWVCSDESWRLTDQGPIQANNEYDGEDYDARLESPGWDQPGFRDASWSQARILDAPAGVLAAQMGDPIRVTEILKPRTIKSPKPGVHIFDMGQNMVGWCRLKVQGAAGTTVQLRHAETLNSDGTLYTANLRSAKATDHYTLKGTGPEIYEPRFTYHGFRYVEITGFPGTPDLAAIEGCVVHDDLPRAGEFACSNELLNQIARNIFWGTRGNYRSIITDCPQRDERQAWLGDRAAEGLGETSLFNIAPIYGKWLADIADSQQPDGRLSDVTPAYWPFYNNNVTWPSLAIIVPGMLYDEYGDLRALQQNYPVMKKWMGLMGGTVRDGITAADNYGDWCAPPETQQLIHTKDPARKTDGSLLATSYYFHDLRLMARYAAILGQPEDARGFGREADIIQAAFNRRFYKSVQAQYDNGSQTSFILPLMFDMVPADQRARVFEQLVDKITNQTPGMIGTGLIGGQWLMRTLCDNGRPDLAYAIATRTEYPSWGYMVRQGATTMWELWNGNTADPAMNSGNHVMLIGDLYIWMNRYLAGIRSDPGQVGYKHIMIRPVIQGDLQFVRAWRDSPYGRIVSNWKRDARELTMEVTIPGNTTALVYVPAKDAAGVSESGKPTDKVEGVKFLRMEHNAAVYAVGAGIYRFQSTLPENIKS